MKTSYQIELAPAAQRQIKKLPNSVQRLVFQQLEALKSNPRPDGVKKLAGMENLYRVRVGSYRIIYAIEDEVLLIVVVKVANRDEVYRNLSNLR